MTCLILLRQFSHTSRPPRSFCQMIRHLGNSTHLRHFPQEFRQTNSEKGTNGSMFLRAKSKSKFYHRNRIWYPRPEESNVRYAKAEHGFSRPIPNAHPPLVGTLALFNSSCLTIPLPKSSNHFPSQHNPSSQLGDANGKYAGTQQTRRGSFSIHSC